jgi:hypothetical protein
MYGVSPDMLAKMYVENSLQNRGEGFSFSVKNKIESGSISGVTKLAVDGEERSLEGATVQIGERSKPILDISWSSPLYVPYGATLTIHVSGNLDLGEHTINMQINVPELGRISLPIIDVVT